MNANVHGPRVNPNINPKKIWKQILSAQILMCADRASSGEECRED